MKPLQLLMVEDSDDDAELTVRQLRRAGREVVLRRVDTRDAFDSALVEREWDVILCDHSMPRFSGVEALQRFRQSQLDTPFIILSGTIGEENAVAAMKQGASDYILKGNLARLPSAIDRELLESQARRAHRAASEALARSEAHLRTLLENAADGVLTVDEDQRIQSFNPAAEQMFGARSEDVLGTPATGLLGSWGMMVAQGGHHDCVAKRSEGRFFSAQVAISEMTVDGRRIYLALVRDVSEQHQTEARLRQLAEENEALYLKAQKAVALRDEFLAVASHELRTPLTPLSLKLQYLQRLAEARAFTPLSHVSVQDALSMAQRQMQRITRLVSGLLDVSRISSGRLQMDMAQVDMASVVRDSLEQLTQDATQAGCTLHFVAAGVTEGSWDRLRLEQVVINLLTNAIKYGAGYPIWVQVCGDGQKAVLTVRDEGIGVDQKDLSRIFDKFERGVSDRHYGGLGLGLYITREIVQALQGTIHCESQHGRGATFTVELPQGPLALQSPLGSVDAGAGAASGPEVV